MLHILPIVSPTEIIYIFKVPFFVVENEELKFTYVKIRHKTKKTGLIIHDIENRENPITDDPDQQMFDLNYIRQYRTKLLEETDYYFLYDVEIETEKDARLKLYRQKLRDLPNEYLLLDDKTKLSMNFSF